MRLYRNKKKPAPITWGRRAMRLPPSAAAPQIVPVLQGSLYLRLGGVTGGRLGLAVGVTAGVAPDVAAGVEAIVEPPVGLAADTVAAKAVGTTSEKPTAAATPKQRIFNMASPRKQKFQDSLRLAQWNLQKQS